MSTAFKPPRFYPILDTAVLAQRNVRPLDLAQIAIAGGVRILQYRHKGNWTNAEYEEAAEIGTRCNEAGVLFVLNDRADYARLLKAALHIGQDDLPPAAARKIIFDEVMGFSTHNREQLLLAVDEPVEYLSIGPIFATGSKQNPDPVVGLNGLRTLRPLSPKPVVAIGGIELANAREVLDAGADSVAIISGLIPDSTAPKSLAQRMADWLKTTA